jgi:ABC-type nitrate/sulfonate/bicarbonate transport system substrate-binding protein
MKAPSSHLLTKSIDRNHMRFNRKIVLLPLVAIVTLGSLAGCASSGDGTGSGGATPSEIEQPRAASVTDLKLSEPVDIKVGLLNPNYSYHASILLAQELGVFEDFGLNVTFENINAVDALPLLARGDLDIQDATFGAGFLNGIDQGLEVRCLATNKIPPSEGPEALYARAGLFADPANPTAAELKGATVATGGGPTSTAVYAMQVYFNEEFGLDVTDLNLVQMASPEHLVALSNGSIDVGFLLAPFYNEAASHGISRLGPLDTPVHCAQAGPRVAQNPDIGAAYLAALQYTNETFLGPGHLEVTEVVDALANATGQDSSVIRDLDSSEFRVRALDPSIFAGAQDVFRSLGVLEYDENMDYDQIVSSTALDRLPE